MRSEPYKSIDGYELHLDPYGDLEYCIGSGDDFVCFAYNIEDGRLRIESTLNSETGHFLQTFNQPVVVSVGSFEKVKEAVLDEIYSALDWCAENDVKHTKAGWNQDPFYLYREIIMDVMNVGYNQFSNREKRLGGKRIDKLTGLDQTSWGKK